MHISIAIKLNIFLYLYSAATDNYEYLQWIQIYQIPWRKGRHNELWLIPGTAYWISALAGVEVKGKGLENDLVWREGRHCWGASGTLSSVISIIVVHSQQVWKQATGSSFKCRSMFHRRDYSVLYLPSILTRIIEVHIHSLKHNTCLCFETQLSFVLSSLFCAEQQAGIQGRCRHWKKGNPKHFSRFFALFWRYSSRKGDQAYHREAAEADDAILKHLNWCGWIMLLYRDSIICIFLVKTSLHIE